MLGWWAAVAVAYEVDAWTPRTVGVDDALPLANAYFEGLLDQAVAETRCDGSDEEVRRDLARAIRRTTARRVMLTDRRGLSRMGHGLYSGWLESETAIPRVQTGNDGVFATVRLSDGFILHAAGTAATVRFGDVLLGTDKVDHFLATGFSYFRWSRGGEKPERAAVRGIRTERTFLGQLTSRSFSHADLAANWDGYAFYAGLLTPGSVLQRGADGCPVRVASWDWDDWVQPDWDEFVNPSVYGRRVSRAVAEGIQADRDVICADWEPVEPRIPLPKRVPVAPGPLGVSCD
jgi:hypothetical protein